MGPSFQRDHLQNLPPQMSTDVASPSYLFAFRYLSYSGKKTHKIYKIIHNSTTLFHMCNLKGNIRVDEFPALFWLSPVLNVICLLPLFPSEH